MNNMLVLLCFVGLVACGSDNESSQSKVPEVKDTIFADSQKAIEKAKQLEQLNQQHKEQLDKAIDQESR